MTDLISRADAIAYIDRIINSGLGRNKSLNYIHKYISSLPSADAVSREVCDIIEPNKIYCSPQLAHNVEVVVRCKDCIHGERDAVSVYCTRYYRRIGTEDYCSSGERRNP